MVLRISATRKMTLASAYRTPSSFSLTRKAPGSTP